MSQQHFVEGFLTKCAEAGLSQSQAVAFLNKIQSALGPGGMGALGGAALGGGAGALAHYLGGEDPSQVLTGYDPEGNPEMHPESNPMLERILKGIALGGMSGGAAGTAYGLGQGAA